MANTNAVPQGLFGPGILFIKRTDVPNQMPVNIGKVQEFSYDLSGTTKQLYGQNQLPLLAARAEVKATGKMKAALLSGLAINSALWGDTLIAGQLSYIQTAATAIPVSPFTITVSVPDTGTFDQDLGVINAATGVPLTWVPSGPTAGQYTNTLGAYLFSNADNVSNVSVKISYAYTHTAAGGQRLIFNNKLIGDTPTFQIDYFSTLYGAGYYVRFFNAISSKLAMSHKLSDFAMPEIDFEFFCNAADQLFEMSFATVA